MRYCNSVSPVGNDSITTRWPCTCLLLLLVALCLPACIAAQHSTLVVPPVTAAVTGNMDSLKLEMAKQKKATAAQFAKVELTAMVTKTTGGTFGYYIFADGQLLIDQKTIPGLPGNSGFITEAEARLVAEFAISKIKEGEMPPTISSEELKQLQITASYPEIKTKN